MEQARTRTRRRAGLASDLTILGIVGVLLLAAIAAGGLSLYRDFYGPSAFVERYLDLLSSGRAADALRVPGVAVDRAALEENGIDGAASEALLRRAALAPLDDVEIVSETEQDGSFLVTADFRAGGAKGRTTFTVVQDGWVGVTPNWSFAVSPLAEVELRLRGADRFAVNGFEVDRRQVSAQGADADPLEPLHLLVFTPGVYSVTVDTAISHTPGVKVLADTPLARTPVEVQAQPTEEFREVVQQRVEEFLEGCTTQEVLQPTACPFGLTVRNRIASPPKWSIVQHPTVTVVPDGANWAIPPADAVAHIEVDIQSLFDGSIDHVSEDVPFRINGTIAILPDGSASIRVGSPDVESD
ncbi:MULTISPECIES: hypothetical protein [Microbacterium]|uniref:hypothetical protein n=1 Tax=Microbacterium TaxID=33882 RepID=UPI00217D9B8D|nr:MULTISPECIES: hypothetical protein [Microbacterium]UWF77457.1 hypothetical protein JSY13_12010 [Microbacterium neungamense]WCM55620.1 hypothetical protein JRG78_12020 [Microbacterium sp. EF45047]